MGSRNSVGRDTEATFADTQLIDKIARSYLFHGAEALCKLLYFLAEKAHSDPEYSAKEYEIATLVFNRKSDFDPRADSSVRVQVARLRSKLIEYYTTEGGDEPIHVEIPKGAYKLQFVSNPKANEGISDVQEQESPERYDSHEPLPPAFDASDGLIAGEEEGGGRWSIRQVVIGASLLALLVAGVMVVAGLRLKAAPKMADAKPQTLQGDPVLHKFWQVFTAAPEQTWVIFSNARFVGNAVAGLRYFDPQRDHPQDTHAYYTGVGEVIGVHDLDRMFASFGDAIRVKRGALLSLEDVKETNLIFLGAPTENSILGNLTTLRSFQFQEISSGVREGQVSILNRSPGPGEQPVYMITNVPSKPLVEDYAVVAMLPGMTSSHRIFIAAGTTTIGTQAAVEYVCNPDTVSELVKQLGDAGRDLPFEVLLHVTVVNDVPIDTKIVAVHKVLR